MLTNNIQEWRDVRLWDETMYLGNGLNFFADKQISDWGPIYSLWYFTLNFFASDPINLYYLNYKLMVILLPVVLSIYLFRLTNNVIISFFYSYLMLVSMINLGTWPKVSHFTLILILTCFIIILKVRSNGKKLSIASFIALMTAYVRPEFFLAFLIFLTILGLQVVRKKINRINFISITVSAIVLLSVLGIPYSSSRSLTAFGEAYVKDIPQIEKIDKDGKTKGWNEILDENFGNPKSLLEVITNNGREFFNHLWHNIKNLPYLYTNYKDLIFPTQFIHISNPILQTLLLSIISLIPFLLIILADRNSNVSFIDLLNNIKFIIGISIIFSLPPLLSIILFFPRSHYLLLLIPLFYSLFVVIFIPLKIKRTLNEILCFSFILSLSFLVLPNLSSWFGKSDLKVRRIIEDIRKLNIQGNVNMLENNGGFAYYLVPFQVNE